MNYRYKRNQIFAKKLNVPKAVQYQIYNKSLSIEDFIEYDLFDKIPLECIKEKDQEIVKKVGIENLKKLDKKILDRRFLSYENINDFLLSEIDPNKDINEALYDYIDKNNLLKSYEYPDEMKKYFSNRFIEASENDSPELKLIINRFNQGSLDVDEILTNWDILKDKDLSMVLKNNPDISGENIRNFMTNYIDAYNLIKKYETNPYFFREFLKQTISNESIKEEMDILLKRSVSNREYEKIDLTNDEYKTIFKYTSLKDFLIDTSKDEYYINKIYDELSEKGLDENYLLDMSIPVKELLFNDVLALISHLGLTNLVDFNNENNNFLIENNCFELENLYGVYLRRNGQYYDSKISPLSVLSENPTKEELYECIKMMFSLGSTQIENAKLAANYQNLEGKFRIENPELFLSGNAPSELQEKFYQKSLSTNDLKEHPEYLNFLKDKNIYTYMSSFNVEKIDENNSELTDNFYRYLEEKFGREETLKFVMEYEELLYLIHNNISSSYKLNTTDDLDKIKSDLVKELADLILKGAPYSENVPDKMKEEYPSFFLQTDAPNDLKDNFYNKKINYNYMTEHPNYIEYLRNVDIKVLYSHMKINVRKGNEQGSQIYQENLGSLLTNKFGKEDAFNIMLLYGKYLEELKNNYLLAKINFDENDRSDKIIDKIDDEIYDGIVNSNIVYNEDIPTHFKNNYPALFLGKDVPEEIKNKFYNKEFTVDDFQNNEELLQIIGDTNVVCGLPSKYSWMIPIFKDNNQSVNKNRLKVLKEYDYIDDNVLQSSFEDYIKENQESLDFENLKYAAEVLRRLSKTNSEEMKNFKSALASKLLTSSNPLKTLDEVEKVFLKNQIPTIGKVYSCFELLYPDFKGLNFNNDIVSPVLKNSSNEAKRAIIFSDLIKATLGSNNRSIRKYLADLEFGSNAFEQIKRNNIDIDSLDDITKNRLEKFSNELIAIYNNTKAGKENTYEASGDVQKDIMEVAKKLSPDGDINYYLGNRIVRMFFGIAGFNTIDEVEKYMDNKVIEAEKRNIQESKSDLKLNEGDFVKGIGGITYLRAILQNGSVSREYLGSSAGSDLTALDTDLSRIGTSEGTIENQINPTASSSYGPIWFVLKNDERLQTTRTINNFDLPKKHQNNKLEVFYTGVIGPDHYGIRTGFPSTDIDCIISENLDDRIGVTIAANGFYIPVADKSGKITFTIDDYKDLRSKMAGLSYYGENEYKFSDNLVTEETASIASQIEENNIETSIKREKINEAISKSLSEVGLNLKYGLDNDLTPGYVDLIDTGSTGRGTNKPHDGDFDFMMRIDKEILMDPIKLGKLKETIKKNLGTIAEPNMTADGDFRFKGVTLPDGTTVDIDITFTQKTDNINYSTDMCLKDRLETIKNQDSEKYNYVVANILLAKKVLKNAECYKPNRGEVPQGGLGGVGVENWILQNGGSFLDAAENFLKASESKDFDTFKSNYEIWDFGENYMSAKKGSYPHDNFVDRNMSEEGYNKMKIALKEYLKNMNISNEETNEYTR